MPYVRPDFRVRCPYCGAPFHPGDCAVVSTANPGKILHNRPVPNTEEYVRSRTWIEELTGPEYTMEMAVRQCPYCGTLLFEGIEECDNITIAIVGDVASGMTTYIGISVDLLKRGTLMQNGKGLSQFTPRNRATIKIYQDIYYDPIIKERRVAIQTRPGRFDQQGNPLRIEPLIYKLVIQDDFPSPGVMLNLLLYDIAAEDIADSTALVQFGEHILRADGIIYLADPMSMERVRGAFRPETMDMTTGRSAEVVLTTVMYRLKQYRNLHPGEPIPVPTAIAISKADLLQYIIKEQERHNYWLFHQPVYDGIAHRDDIQHVDREVRSILNSYGEQALVQLGNGFTNASFFAVSQTGGPPDHYGMYPSIQPHRCLDPFIWLLWKLGYIQAVS